MNCKKCSAPNDQDSIYCKLCGHRLRAAKRGFASMDKNKQRQIASAAGKKAHTDGKAHTWNSEEAAKAGRKGGMNKRKN